MPTRLRSMLGATILSLILASTLCQAKLHVKQGKFTLIDSVGITSQALDFDSESTVEPLKHLELEPGDSLKLTFSVTQSHSEEELEDKPLQPQQAMILWQPVSTARDYLSVIKVRKNGKAKWDLEIARAPSGILSLSDKQIKLTLLIGHPKESNSIQIPLGSFTLPPTLVQSEDDDLRLLPKSWNVEQFKVLPELNWSFKPQEKKVKFVISLIGTCAVLSPWLIFVAVIVNLPPNFSGSLSANILLFLLSLLSFESFIIFYWTSLKLLPSIPYFLGLSLITGLTGRRALGDLRRLRIEKEGKSRKSE